MRAGEEYAPAWPAPDRLRSSRLGSTRLDLAQLGDTMHTHLGGAILCSSRDKLRACSRNHSKAHTYFALSLSRSNSLCLAKQFGGSSAGAATCDSAK